MVYYGIYVEVKMVHIISKERRGIVRKFRGIFEVIKILLKIILLVVVLAFVLYSVFVFVITSLWHTSAIPYYTADALLSLLRDAIIAGFLVFVFLIVRVSRYKPNRLNTEMKKELLENGMSDRFFEIVDQGIELHKKYPNDYLNYNQFALMGAEGYMVRGNLEKALQYLELIDEKKLRDKKYNSVDSWHSILFYLLVKMELIVEQLEAAETADSPDSTEFAGADVGVVSDMAEGNEYVPSPLVAQADAIFTEASAFREKDYGKIPEEDMLLDEIYTLNSFIHKDYSASLDYSQKVIDNKMHRENKLISGHLLQAYIYHKLGDRAKVDELFAQMNQIMDVSKSGISRDTYEFYRKKIERDNGNVQV